MGKEEVKDNEKVKDGAFTEKQKQQEAGRIGMEYKEILRVRVIQL